MSRKHYIEVAAMLRKHRDENDVTTTRSIALEFALIAKRDNPRFNAGKFFEAAGFPELTATRQGLN